MDDLLERKSILAIAGLVGAVVLVGALLMSGGQVSTILSTVGAPIPDHVGTVVGSQPEQPSSTAGPAGTGGPEIASTDALAPAPGLLIVHSGALKVRVAAISAAIDRVTAIVTGSGGYIATSKAAGVGPDAVATIDLRVPAAAWDRTLTDVRAIGTVLDQQVGSEEVTGQVLDLDARVANLRATEAALQAIMAKATKIDDVLAVQKELTDTRGEIEQLVAKAAGLRNRAAFGSLTLDLSVPTPVATPPPTASRPPLWDPGRDVALASGRLVRIGQVGTTAAIWLAIVGVPIALALAIGVGILRLAWLEARRVGLIGSRETG